MNSIPSTLRKLSVAHNGNAEFLCKNLRTAQFDEAGGDGVEGTSGNRGQKDTPGKFGILQGTDGERRRIAEMV